MKALQASIGILGLALNLNGALVVIPGKAPVQGQVIDFHVSGVPLVTNPFATGVISATFTAPSGVKVKVPGFWYQAYTNALENRNEKLTAQGEPGWRVRFSPAESGSYTVHLVVNLEDGEQKLQTNFTAGAASGGTSHGPVGISANKRYFEVDGKALVLNGKNVCWHGSRGTFDYKDWFPAMKDAGENYARLWMAPWAFGLQTDPDTLKRYRLDRAWQLDEVFDLALRNGIYLMLCFDYHGMFQTKPDFWGANNNWKINPYNRQNGGPCAEPNEFFTNNEAKELYKQRIAYVVARYGAYPNVLSWQFLNEIDNVYNLLKAADVAAWHKEMSVWLHENDPWKRLVTTSLTGGSNRAEIWTIPGIDFVMYHSYGLAEPAAKLPGILERMHARYGKPVMLGEYGVDFRGFKCEADPYFRGLRQGIWAGLMGGSVGTGMSWWWESLHAHDAYKHYNAVAMVLSGTKLGAGSWRPVELVKSEAVTAIGMRSGSEALVYVVNSAINYPAKAAAKEVEPITNGQLQLIRWPEGKYAAEWFDAATGKKLESTGGSVTDGQLSIGLPMFTEDIAGRIRLEL